MENLKSTNSLSKSRGSKTAMLTTHQHTKVLCRSVQNFTVISQLGVCHVYVRLGILLNFIKHSRPNCFLPRSDWHMAENSISRTNMDKHN